MPLIINALLAEVYLCQSASEPLSSRSFALRENLKQFFVAKAAKKPADSCCSAEERASCCEPSARATCCGSTEQSAGTTCGCR